METSRFKLLIAVMLLLISAVSVSAQGKVTDSSPSNAGRSVILTPRSKLDAVRRSPSPAISNRSAAAAASVRGFDENGQPYIEERMPDGTVKRTSENGVQVTKPDGTKQFVPFQFTRQNAPPPTPPVLPDDPTRGRAWMVSHNENLLMIIQKLVKDDKSAVKRFLEAERQANKKDIFEQIDYRTNVANFLAGTP